MAAPDQAKEFAKYLHESRIFIVDTSSASRARLAKTLVDMGAQTSKISMIGNAETAISELAAAQPRVILCDYHLGKLSGFDLLRTHREANKNAPDHLYVLITANASQSAVAKAAEEDIDAFILKPYTIDSLKAGLLNAAIAKLFPSEYIQTVRKGRDLLFSAQIEEAIQTFVTAKGMSPSPTLACFYLGQAMYMKEALAEAQGAYSEGLSLNKIHFKCLVGLFDLLYGQKRYHDAYAIMTKIAEFFPANPDRLATVIRLTVLTANYNDIERYYGIFTGLDARNDEIVNYMCAGLIIAAKYHLLRNAPDRALDLLKKASISCAGNTRFLRKMIMLLLEFNMGANTQEFLVRFPAVEQDKADYLVSKYLVANNQNGDIGAAIEDGRALIGRGIKDPDIYKILIQRLIELKKFDNAEQFAHELVTIDSSTGQEFLSTIEVLSAEGQLPEVGA